ncbi:MAG TPA: zf-TFIIB domain-containing protein [Polyangiales bacterium]|jgi:Zn-finger nucleic acid-binding protein|nr:zf-TFIIB domain-containing protein [Polyangiales bacterium]
MSKGKAHKSDKIINCPRCHANMLEVTEKTAYLDRCPKGHGTFFDQGEMFEALGTAADPSFWDRPGNASPVRPGKLSCPRCHAAMLQQDIASAKLRVEIDRCGSCKGIWLDHGEAEKLMSIGGENAGAVFEERRKAQAELDAMGDVDFRAGGLIQKFLSLFNQ